MSWQLASLGVLALGLAGGFAWYERRRPDARIVALVGTLAAFGALGRIAFAAVPNVKPTGDIVLISGYALGGAPGYVVGAVAALASNFFFGQGPWTPWQMAGWGLTGAAGALLARLSRGRIARLPLALVCAVLGFAFTAMQDCGDWVMYSDHSLVQLGLYVGQGLGFDLVYAAGCFGFAMLFGPALVRTLARFRARIQVTWLPRAPGGAGLPLVAVAVALAAGVAAGVSPARAVAAGRRRSPVQYLEASQNKDGGWGAGRGQASDPMFSAWAVMALAAAHIAPQSVARDGHSAVGYLQATIRQERGAGALERTILAVRAAGLSARDFAHVNLVARLRRLILPDGSISNLTNLTTFGALALERAGARPPARMIAWLARQQDSDGGFNYATAGGVSDVEDTAAVVAVLGQPAWRDLGERALTRALTYIRGQQNADGGFGFAPGAPSDAQSTAFVVSGLIGAGVDPASLHRRGAPSPVAYLRSMVQPDGAVDYSRGNAQTPVWVTGEAEIALAGSTF